MLYVLRSSVVLCSISLCSTKTHIPLVFSVRVAVLLVALRWRRRSVLCSLARPHGRMVDFAGTEPAVVTLIDKSRGGCVLFSLNDICCRVKILVLTDKP
ncbi:hypothetical protein E2C01_100687 [Portunus trituberculatus]|uniref:Uncharacterized protein n=1 Tax=Portunus trituberculatus TaxID=210409 RepID=A0A5B7K3S2_PORTR|nr:hypothetical protein [Portunus trituberculatus]